MVMKLLSKLPFESRHSYARLMDETSELDALKLEDPDRFATLEAEYPLRKARQDAEAAEHAERQRMADLEQERSRRTERLRRAGVALRDEVAELCRDSALGATEAVEAVRGWWEDRPTPWLVLSGRTGSGKTVAAASAIADTGGVWMRADDVVRAFSGMFGDPLEKQERAKIAYLLVLDDIGSELDAARMLPALLELIDTRISARGRPTICTTNLTKKEFAERYANDRLNSRMRELVTWKSLTTPDMRGKSKPATGKGGT
jgi:DNA replication protein DnaC